METVKLSSHNDMSDFARTIYEAKYSKRNEDGTTEKWSDTAKRVTLHVLSALVPPS